MPRGGVGRRRGEVHGRAQLGFGRAQEGHAVTGASVSPGVGGVVEAVRGWSRPRAPVSCAVSGLLVRVNGPQ
ncbi:hypothetical protein SLNWT_3513 [Streptomyces albus]|uniref:Uncharacterized protein n=1 Tax=Streptomyces albus (strain ATCC 21838 / DSM 41398 / FERM P-419 / JCM 4703 / NBRC 107858) TaxID=1081613 RepID=A0A0B5EQM0_STRA4|nr:hypothetical protein SLNWT_3513 [Streptomyces albus]AOU78193.1 hypothetical protein SLNHY_3502 [Streptomyces albus]AYN33946.1 hypothetical protein DUI70_3446 [Streptomyces albus]